jgi:hypothetical protein
VRCPLSHRLCDCEEYPKKKGHLYFAEKGTFLLCLDTEHETTPQIWGAACSWFEQLILVVVVITATAGFTAPNSQRCSQSLQPVARAAGCCSSGCSGTHGLTTFGYAAHGFSTHGLTTFCDAAHGFTTHGLATFCDAAFSNTAFSKATFCDTAFSKTTFGYAAHRFTTHGFATKG